MKIFCLPRSSFLSPGARTSFPQVVHYVNRDGRGLAEDFRDLGFIPATADVSAVARALNRSFKTRGARPAGSSALNFQVGGEVGDRAVQERGSTVVLEVWTF